MTSLVPGGTWHVKENTLTDLRRKLHWLLLCLFKHLFIMTWKKAVISEICTYLLFSILWLKSSLFPLPGTCLCQVLGKAVKLRGWEGTLGGLAFEMGPISKHNQEGQHQATLGTLHPVSLKHAFRIHNPEIEEKWKNGRVDGDFKFVWSQLGSNNGWIKWGE